MALICSTKALKFEHDNRDTLRQSVVPGEINSSSKYGGDCNYAYSKLLWMANDVIVPATQSVLRLHLCKPFGPPPLWMLQVIYTVVPLDLQ